MKRKILTIAIGSILGTGCFLSQQAAVQAADDGFKFICGNSNVRGTGTFEQPIAQSVTVAVGKSDTTPLPTGITDLIIQLTSASDVDVQLYDAENGKPIVQWPDGILKGSTKQTTQYEGMTIEWSGYNGGQTATTLGNEYIKITGTTSRELTMKAFGYQAGTAKVDYSYVPPVCIGGGTFDQVLQRNQVSAVGGSDTIPIPPNIPEVYIKLRSDKDLDVRLYDNQTNTPIVKWPDGLLGGSGKQETTYQGMRIEWSGYNGGQTPDTLGEEYIRISGNTTRPLTMEAFGYEEGKSEVSYSYGPVEERPLDPTTFSDNEKRSLTIRDSVTNEPVRVTSCTFADVASSDWFAPYVTQLCSAKILVGYSQSGQRVYKPTQNANLVEVLKVLHYVQDYKTTGTECDPTEKDANNWYQCHLNFALQKGGGNIVNLSNPSAQITRGDAFRYVMKIFFNEANLDANTATQRLYQLGVIKVTNTSANYINRAELATLAFNAGAKAGVKVPYGLVDNPPPAVNDIPSNMVASTPNASAPDFVQQILNKTWAELGHVGAPWTDKNYTYCARFVRRMFDVPAKYDSAAAMCNNFKNKGVLQTGKSNIPTGSAICYYASSGNGGFGHVSVYVGNGEEIGVTSRTLGVTKDPATSRGKFMGWVSPQNYKDKY